MRKVNGLKAELIAVGTELLTGQIVNTNAQYLSEKCAEWGIDVYFQTAVGDNRERLLSVLEVARQRSDLIILCGGLGPTEDDLTKQTLAQFLGKNLVIDPQAMDKLDRFFASRPGRVRTPNNDRQALLIEGSCPLPNPAGLAVGGLITVDGVTYVVLPGPPSELKAMVQDSLAPFLGKTEQQLYSRVLRFFGIGESQLVTLLDDIIAQQTDPTVAPYAKTGEVTLRLSTKAYDQAEADDLFDELEERICRRGDLHSFLYGYGEENSLAQVVAGLLEERQLKITFLEQATAGGIQSQLAHALTQKECYGGGRIQPHLAMQKDSIFAALSVIWQKSEADLAVAICLEEVGTSSEGLVKVRVGLALLWEKEKEYQEFEVSGYSWPHVQTLVGLHTFDLVRKTLSNTKSLL